jgi:hypothetical protein
MEQNLRKKNSSFFLVIGITVIVFLIIGIMIGYRLEKNIRFSFSNENNQPLSPDQIYANKMGEIIKNVDTFVDKSVKDWDSFLNKKIPNGNITYRIFIEDFITASESGEDLKEIKESKAYKNILEKADAIIEEGYKVNSLLGSIVPPPGIKFAHEELAVCVQDNVVQMQFIRYYLVYGIYEEPSYKCKSYEAARNLILEFIKENRLKQITF